MSKDVKTTEASTVDSAKTEAAVTEVKTEEAKDLEYGTIGLEAKEVPYPRFKEVNNKYRETEKKLKTLEKDIERRVQDEVYRKEMELRRHYEANQKPQDDFSYPDDNHEVKNLKAELEAIKKQVATVSNVTEQDRIQRTVETLKTEFPALDEEHVLTIKRARPEWSWEECAEYSHKHFSGHLENQWKNLVESKKVQATKKVIGSEGIRNLKPEERPKTFNDAARMAAKFLGD